MCQSTHFRCNRRPGSSVRPPGRRQRNPSPVKRPGECTRPATHRRFGRSGCSRSRRRRGEPAPGIEPGTFRLQEGWEAFTLVTSRRHEFNRSPHEGRSAPWFAAISHHDRHHERPALPPHRGATELRSYFASRLGSGGIGLECCQMTDDGVRCAFEYNCVRSGGQELTPQAGAPRPARGSRSAMPTQRRRPGPRAGPSCRHRSGAPAAPDPRRCDRPRTPRRQQPVRRRCSRVVEVLPSGRHLPDLRTSTK
jgi:hypothetical protein